MAIVYAVQNPHWRDRNSGEFVPKYDLTSAADFGPVEFLLDHAAGPDDPEAVLDILEDKLSSFVNDDYILLIGNPVLIALTAVMAAENADRINFLQWNGRTRLYAPIPVDFS